MNNFTNYPQMMDNKFNQLKKETEKNKEELEQSFENIVLDTVPVDIKPCTKDLSDKIVH